jgi:hypothetical protein
MRHDPTVHDDHPLPPIPDEDVDYMRTHEWMGFEDDSPCAVCFVLFADCEDVCPGE